MSLASYIIFISSHANIENSRFKLKYTHNQEVLTCKEKQNQLASAYVAYVVKTPVCQNISQDSKKPSQH